MRRPLLVVAMLAALVPPASATVTSTSLPMSENARSRYLDLDQRIAGLRSATGSGSFATALGAVIEQRPGWTVDRELVNVAIPGDAAAAVTLLETTVRKAQRLLVHDVASSRPAQAAAMLVTSALDRALPVLISDGSLTKPNAGTVAGCDLLDHPPYLCVGSIGNNLYSKDVALLVDLGGNDTYENSAGGAPFSSAGGEFMPISINVDVSGSDTYTGSSPHPDAPETLLGQAAAYGTAVGILVDGGGDDWYSLAAPPDKPGTYVLGQGAAAGNAVAALFDLGGNDRYLAQTSAGGERTGATVQAYASNSSAALLSDSGRGNDVYEVDAGSAVMEREFGGEVGPSAGVGGQGMASVFASAAVYDDGGVDSFQATAAAVNERPSQGGEPGSPDPLPGAGITGQGAAQTGTAFVLTGEGPTTFRMTIAGTGPSALDAYGQGSGLGPGGIGVLDDLGGDDSYSVDFRQTVNHTTEIDDSCREGKPAKPCTRARETVFAGGDLVLYAQGAAQSGGNGLLRDQAGNDRYAATLDQSTDIALHDHLTAPSGSPELRVSGFSMPLIALQGASTIGTGMLVELGGSDDYLLALAQRTSARATSAHADGVPRVIARQGGSGDIVAQGATFYPGEALFLDTAGVGDRVETRVGVATEASPDPSGEFSSMWWWPAVQGAGVNAQFAVLGTGAVVRSSPSRPACPAGPAGPEGFRGFGTWADCPSRLGGGGSEPDHQNYESASTGGPASGIVSSAVGAKPSLVFTADTPTVAPADHHEQPDPDAARLSVGAVLRDPAGIPIEGQLIRFTLQESFGTYWGNEWQVGAVTDANGEARASLPLSGWSNLPGDPWRVLASYDGGPGIYPRHVASPLAEA